MMIPTVINLSMFITLPDGKKVRRERPKYDIYIGRALNYPKATFSQSKWFNPYTLKAYGENALVMYEKRVRTTRLWNMLHELSDKIIGCWCFPNPCHGLVIAKLFAEKFVESLDTDIYGAVINPNECIYGEVREEYHDKHTNEVIGESKVIGYEPIDSRLEVWSSW